MPDAFGTAPAARKPYPWTEIFRCFQVALDPRKLLVAAAGILAMSLGWYALSCVFVKSEPKETAAEYSFDVVKQDYANRKKADGSNFSEDEIKAEARKRYERDLNQYRFNYSLAGEGGRIRSMPWYEDRGANPYLYLTAVASKPSSMWFAGTWDYVKAQLPVMAEPLAKLFLPIVKFTDPNASTMTRLYLFLVLVWNVLVWAFCGGVITRIAAVQLSGKDRVSIGAAVSFVCKRYVSYALSPIVPVGVVGAVIVGLCLFGMICLIPILGDVLYGIVGIPFMILGGIMMTILFIGLVGYPLMTATLSTEGSDTFDALSRSYNYVFQSPWTYAWNWFVALLYGTVVTFFVVLVCSLMVYLGKWAICQTPLSESTDQRPDYLFIYAPESFDWKTLLLRGTDLQGGVSQTTHHYTYSNPEDAGAYIKSYRWWNWVGAGLTTFWLTSVFLLMLGFSYSFFWSASTMIYLLMRQKVDEVDLDEVYLEDDEPPPPPPSPVVVPTPTPSAPASLPMVTAPPPPPAPVSPLPVSQQIPVTPSVSSTMETPKLPDSKK